MDIQYTNELGTNPTDVSMLDIELQFCVNDHPHVGRCLKHPLVFQVPFYSWKMANRALVWKQAQIADAIDARDWSRAIFLYERAYRLTVLGRMFFRDKRFGVPELRKLLPEVWMDTENPTQHRGYPIRLYRAAGYASDAPRRLSGTLQVFRGDVRRRIGMEWSLSRSVAEWFAVRFNPKGWVAIGEVDADDLMGYNIGRGEQEIIVEPSLVRDVTFERVIGPIRRPI